ncbi:MAG: 16S rRNA (cytidine(1402)-2'-O)-methyltransferase [Deltaproteobacteria bacterium]|nr:16S rRNA (cytidine(1402)-2'-O)-methyltransferase [Deltaproteobacteria bacterium]
MSEAGQGMGTLYLLGTPIGHLGDVSDRLREVLASVSVLACEDTRTTRKLLERFQIKGPKLVALPSHDEARRAEPLLEVLREGRDVGLVSEAGMPVVSDPGALLVAGAEALGAPVVVVPGPSAVTTALAASAFPGGRFHFLGFLPRKGSDRRELIAEAGRWPGTLVLFEAPARLKKTLGDLAEAWGGSRRAVICRELTKLHEEHRRGTLAELRDGLEEKVRGEITLVIAPAERAEGPSLGLEEALEQVQARVEGGERLKDACKAVASESGLSSRELYQAAQAR